MIDPFPCAPRSRGAQLVLVLVLVAAATACADPPAPAYRVDKLRVLAIRSEPVAPGSGETTVLDALIYTPPAVSVTSYQWSWCPFAGAPAQGHPCLVSEAELAQLAGGAAVPPYDLGTGATATFENSIDPALLETVCAGTAEQPALVNCADGFPIQVKLVVRAGGAELIAIRRLRLRFAPGHAPNLNPTIDGLVTVEDSIEQPIGDPPPLLRRDEETLIRAQIADAAAERYAGLDDEGEPAEQRESLVFGWFVENGDLDADRTSFLDGVVELADARENAWTPASADEAPAPTADLIVVVRDNRDGVAWRRATVSLGDAP